MAAKIVFSGGANLVIPDATAESVATALASPPEGFACLELEEGKVCVWPDQVAYVLDIEDAEPAGWTIQPAERRDSDSEFG